MRKYWIYVNYWVWDHGLCMVDEQKYIASLMPFKGRQYHNNKKELEDFLLKRFKHIGATEIEIKSISHCGEAEMLDGLLEEEYLDYEKELARGNIVQTK